MIPRSLSRAFPSLCLLVGWVTMTNLGRAAEASAPNVILMVADDLGAHDLGVTGSRFQVDRKSVV